MREQDIRELIEAEPFEPFVMHVSDGPRYEVRFRSDILAMRHVVYLGVDPDAAGVPRRSLRIDPVHITRLVPSKRPRQHKRS